MCGPIQTESFGGARYFVTFSDDYSRYCAVYFIKQKSEVLEKFKELKAATTNEAGRSIGTLRPDNGGKYLSTEFQDYLKVNDCLSTVVYLRNRIPTATIKGNTTPYERWYERKPNVSHLRVFGCMTYTHAPESKRQKLDKRTEKLRSVNFLGTSKGYRLFDEIKRKVVV